MIFSLCICTAYKNLQRFLSYSKGVANFCKTDDRPSSKELGFLNPRSQLNSTVVTYWPMQLKNREDR